MPSALLWFSSGLGASAAVLFVCFQALRVPLTRVLRDLLASAARARFFRGVFFGLLTTSTLAGSLWPPGSDFGHAAWHVIAARQLLAAGLALLLGLAASGGLLLILIAHHEARRARGSSGLPSTKSPS